MRAVYKRELFSFFSGMMGYIFEAFFLAAIGIYTAIVCIRQGSTSYVYVYYNLSFLFLIIVPILTMRTLSEDRRHKTEQLLFSSPIRVSDLVLGKYFAQLTVFLVPILISCLYPAILSMYGKINLPVTYGLALLFFLLGAAMIAMGVFISSLTENQLVAAAATFGLLLVIYFADALGDLFPDRASVSVLVFSALNLLLLLLVRLVTGNWVFSLSISMVIELVLLGLYLLAPSVLQGAVGKFFGSIGLISCMNSFVYGVVRLEAYIRCLSIAALFVFFTVCSVEKRRLG